MITTTNILIEMKSSRERERLMREVGQYSLPYSFMVQAYKCTIPLPKLLHSRCLHQQTASSTPLTNYQNSKKKEKKQVSGI